MLDRSVQHSFRSLDALCFSSQYYFIISLTTWGIIFLYLGFTSIMRSYYNPFADPTLIFFCLAVSVSTFPIQYMLSYLSNLAKLWQIKGDDRIRVDVAAINRLDAASNMKKLIRNVQTNPFRFKFLMINREWIISNIASILGGRTYLSEAGAEQNYLRHVY